MWSALSGMCWLVYSRRTGPRCAREADVSTLSQYDACTSRQHTSKECCLQIMMPAHSQTMCRQTMQHCRRGPCVGLHDALPATQLAIKAPTHSCTAICAFVCLQIRQVSAQVHDIRNRVKHLVKLLQAKGFDVEVYQEPRFADCNLHMLYASRSA